MSDFDITVIVTAHLEAVVAGPTMHSAMVAIRAAEAEGFRVERIIGLDSASQACSTYFSQEVFSNWKIVELSKRDLGLTRNALVEISKGRWIAFLDADDLFSENWLAESGKMIGEAEKKNEKIIIHPEVNMFFDADNSVLVNVPQHDPLFTPLYWHEANYYDSLIMAPREAFLEVPYAGRNHEKGFAYEDWRWNIETTVRGWIHVAAVDTAIFKRRQDMSLVIELGQRRSLLWDLEPMTIDKIVALGNHEF